MVINFSEAFMTSSFALVTGASSGLGVDFAKQLATRGYNLIITARREDRLLALRDQLINEFGVQVEVIAMDLAAPAAAQALYDEIKSRELEVEVLINNAGYGLYGLFHETDWARQEKMMQLDMVALTRLTKLFSEDMTTRRKGYILLVSSIGAYQPCPTYATYAAAKSYVLHFGEALNYELRHHNVKVSVLSPGITATEFLQVSGQRATPYQRLAMMQSGPVVRTGLKALFKGQASVVPGLMNKIAAFSVRFLPRTVATWLSYVLMRSPEVAVSRSGGKEGARIKATR